MIETRIEHLETKIFLKLNNFREPTQNEYRHWIPQIERYGDPSTAHEN